MIQKYKIDPTKHVLDICLQTSEGILNDVKFICIMKNANFFVTLFFFWKNYVVILFVFSAIFKDKGTASTLCMRFIWLIT